ncbi:MAG: hypothetical protein HY648_00790 [Acidobacteria bacterium]|nr:hypothetical protein [Acidobacteriota bacterium]
MDDKGKLMEVFLDFLPNQPNNAQTRKEFGSLIRQRFEKGLPESVERMWDLPPMMVKPRGEYLSLLLEARELYIAGYFYSCVAMCGIVGERLVKDALRASVLVQKGGSAKLPSDRAFDQFERVEVNGIVRFLKEADVLATEVAKAADDLIQLRNQYAHARGKASQADAIKGIQLLHVLVEDTVSVFKDFEIKEGAFVPKESSNPG